MSFNTGVELSFLKFKEKQAIVDAAAEVRKFLYLMQAKKIREILGSIEGLTTEDVVQILDKQKKKMTL